MKQSSAEPQVARVGEVFAGKYLVEAQLGGGGMGVVFRARHLLLDEVVALKLLAPEATPEASTRLLREARATGCLKSEHVVRILDVEMLPDGRPYLVMECLAGTDLARLLRDHGPRSVVEAVGFVLDACEALAEAHARSIVHRDLKPSNLFLEERADGDRWLKVLDFGIAKSLRDRGEGATITQSDRLLGSPQYMSPEQIRGARAVDARSDVWALGVVLHELVAGAPPFRADGAAAVLAAIMVDSPAPLGEAVPGVPPELERVVLRCLAQDPRDRFPTVLELARALAPFLVDSATRIERMEALVAAVEKVPAVSTDVGPPAGALTADPLGRSDAGSTRDTWAERSQDRPLPPRRPTVVRVVWSAAIAVVVGAVVIGLSRRTELSMDVDAPRSMNPAGATLGARAIEPAPPITHDEPAQASKAVEGPRSPSSTVPGQQRRITPSLKLGAVPKAALPSAPAQSAAPATTPSAAPPVRLEIHDDASRPRWDLDRTVDTRR